MAVLLNCNTAFAISTSAGALRLEDPKRGIIVLGAKQAALHEGEIWKSVVLLWGNLEINGQVEEVVILSGHVHFSKNAKVTKSLVVMGGAFESDTGAQISGEQISFRSPGPLWSALKSSVDVWREHYEGITRWLVAISFCLVMWLMGLVFFATFPKAQAVFVSQLLVEWAKNFSIGVLGMFCAPMLFAMLLISLIGWPLIPFYFLLLLLMGLLSYCVAALWLGHRILPPKAPKKIRPLGLLLGLIVMQLFWSVQVPFTSLFVFFFWLLGWGSLLRGLRLLWK